MIRFPSREELGMDGRSIRDRAEGGSFTVQQIQASCLIHQHLEDFNKESDIATVTDDLCGLHATSTVTPYLSLLARMKKFDPPMLDSELGEHGRLARIRGVRGTLFIVPRSRFPLIRSALGTPTEPAQKWYSLRRMRRSEFFQLRDLILTSLKGRSLSIREIKATVPKSMIRTISFRSSKSVVRSATNVTWVVNWLVFAGVILSEKVGGLQDALRRKRPASDIESLSNRYVLVEDALGKTPRLPQAEARTRFVRWYLENYSPTTLEDLKWWTGLSGQVVRNIVSLLPDIVHIRVEDLHSAMIIPEEQLRLLTDEEPRRPQINLLPYEDPFPKGYRLRDRFGSRKVVERAFTGGSAAPTVLVNGRIVATWKFSVEGERAVFQIQTLEPVEKEVSKGIVNHAEVVADFLFPDGENRVIIR